MNGRRRYFTLLERDGPEHDWRIAFGAFDRAEAVSELEERRAHGVRKGDVRIMVSGAAAEEQAAALKAQNDRPRPLVIVTWRDENYGSLSGATSAFRLYDTLHFSETAVKRIAGRARSAGFEWRQDRCSWISYAPDAPKRFIAGLKALGLAVRNAGSKAATLAHLNSPAASIPEPPPTALED